MSQIGCLLDDKDAISCMFGEDKDDIYIYSTLTGEGFTLETKNPPGEKKYRTSVINNHTMKTQIIYESDDKNNAKTEHKRLLPIFGNFVPYDFFRFFFSSKGLVKDWEKQHVPFQPLFSLNSQGSVCVNVKGLQEIVQSDTRPETKKS